MKRLEAYIVVALLFFIVFPQAGWARISSATVPPSIRREGLIRSPNPIDRSSNLSVTGNIRGGRYFRGVVPYRAPTYFGETTPTSSLDSFLRDSAGSEDFGRFTGRYEPYYSPTQTVTIITPGSSYVTRPPTANIGGYVPQTTPIFGSLPPRITTMRDPGAAISLGRHRPMSLTTEELEERISSETDIYPWLEKLADTQYRSQIEQLRQDTNRPGEEAFELDKNLITRESPLLPSIKSGMAREIPQGVKALPQQKQVEEDEEGAETPPVVSEDMDKQIDVYEQMKKQLDELQKKVGLALAEQEGEELEEALASSSARLQREAALGKDFIDRTQGSNLPSLAIDEGEEITAVEGQTPRSSYISRPVETDLSVTARAQSILGPYETFASFSEDKFNRHMRAAESYLKQGRYYRAADAYTLASVYKPGDPLAYAGKSHALFASGEYMSSALFLSRALEIFPEYAKFKIDLEEMVGDRDKLETRVADVEEWLGRSDAPELHFLLAYIYYQMDRPQRAEEAINAAHEKMPDSPAVLALKKAIEDDK